MALWLVHIGQKLLLWGVWSAVSVAGAILILNFLQFVASYAQTWFKMRSVPTAAGSYPVVGHFLQLKLDARGKGPRPGWPHPPAPRAGGFPACAALPSKGVGGAQLELPAGFLISLEHQGLRGRLLREPLPRMDSQFYPVFPLTPDTIVSALYLYCRMRYFLSLQFKALSAETLQN